MIILALAVVFAMFCLDEILPISSWITITFTWAVCWLILWGFHLPW